MSTKKQRAAHKKQMAVYKDELREIGTLIAPLWSRNHARYQDQAGTVQRPHPL